MFWHNFLSFSCLTSAVVLAAPWTLPKSQQELLPHITVDGHSQLPLTSTIRDVLLSSEIIPQVLDDFEPTYYLDITYPRHHSEVLLGNRLAVKTVAQRPIVAFHALSPPYDDAPNERNLTFTLILTDPDALSYKKPTKSEMCHWIVTNLTTPLQFDLPSTFDDLFDDTFNLIDDLAEEYFDFDLEDEEGPDVEAAKKHKKHKKNKNKKLANELESYQPPTPPKKTGPHRYVFVLLEGDATDLQAPKERPHWGYGKERHGVRDWSNDNNLTVVGANFFYAQNKKQGKHHKKD